MKFKSIFLVLFAISMSNIQSFHRDVYRRRLVARQVMLHHHPRRIAVIRRLTPIQRHRVLIAHRILDTFAKINVNHAFNARSITTAIQLGRRPAHLYRAAGLSIEKQKIANGFKAIIHYANDKLTIMARGRRMVIVCRDYRGKIHRITTQLPRPIGNITRFGRNLRIAIRGNLINITMPR